MDLEVFGVKSYIDLTHEWSVSDICICSEPTDQAMVGLTDQSVLSQLIAKE